MVIIAMVGENRFYLSTSQLHWNVFSTKFKFFGIEMCMVLLINFNVLVISAVLKCCSHCFVAYGIVGKVCFMWKLIEDYAKAFYG